MEKITKTTFESIIAPEKGSLISGPFGSNISKKFFVSEGVPVIRGNNLSLGQEKFIDDGFVYVTKEKAQKLDCYAHCGDIIFTAAGTIGQVGVIPGDSKYKEYVISNKQIRATLDEKKVDILYIYYWLSSPWVRKYLIKNNKGSTVPLLSLNEIRNIPVYYPDIKTQQKISHTISLLDKKIANNNTISEQLESMAKTIYDYWFLQFEFPNEEGKPYKSSGGKMVWNEDLQREIPEGWGVENLYQNSLSKLIKPGIEKFEGNKRYLATADVSGNLYGQGSKITYESRETRANMQPTINSIWFAKMKNSVKHLLLDKSMSVMVNDTILSTGFCGLQCDENNFEYLSSFIESDFFEKTKDSLAHGATQQAVNNTDLQSIALVVPSIDILTKYHKLTSNMFEMMSINKIENERLKSLRNFLLPLLMNGQVSVARLDS